jgi:transposase
MAGFSCEKLRKSPYSDDMRWRMVWQRELQQLTLRQVASNVGIDTSTVSQITKHFRETGSVTKKKYSRSVLQDK